MFMANQLIGFGATTAATFLPTDIANLKVWYRADQGITISTGVSQWNDLSGNAHHLVQATGASQPTYDATSGANSQAGVTFDGSDDSLAVSFSAVSQPFHVFAIIKTVSALDGGSRGLVCGGAIGERMITQGNVVANTIHNYMGSAFVSLSHSNTTNHFIWESLVNGASSSLIRGNTAAATGNPGANTLSGVNLGILPGASNSNIIISDVCIYSAAISGANLTNLRSYFSTRYAVTTT